MSVLGKALPEVFKLLDDSILGICQHLSMLGIVRKTYMGEAVDHSQVIDFLASTVVIVCSPESTIILVE